VNGAEVDFAARLTVDAKLAPTIPRTAARTLARSRRPIIWIGAPAGSGKTTLATQVCEQSGRPFVWLRAEARMADMGSFLTAMLATFRKTFPSETLPALGPEDIAFSVDFLRRLIAAGSRGEPMLLALDDLHVLPADAPALQALAEARRDISDDVRIVLVSREPPHRAWLWFNARGELERIGTDEMRLNEAEAGALLAAHAGIDTGWTASALFEASGGWVLGARLLLQTAASADRDTDVSEANGNLLDLIAHELVAPLGEADRSLLLRTARLPNLPIPVLAHALNVVGAEQTLNRLARQLLFIQRDGRGRLQIHDLLKAALERRYPDAVSAEDVVSIAARAGDALVQRGEVADGLSLLSASGAWDALREAVIIHAPALKERGELGVVLTALEPVPAAIRDDSIVLRYWHGVSLLSLNPPRARELLTDTLEAARAAGEEALLIPIWTALIDAIWLEWIDCSLFDPLIAMLPQLKPLAARLGETHESMLARGAFAAMSFRCPYHPDYPEWEERNLDFYWQPMPRHETIRRGIHLMFRYCFGEGNRWKVTQVRTRLNQVFDEAAAPVADICTRHVVSAEYLSIFEAAGEETFRAVDSGLEANARHQQTFWDGTLLNAGLFKAAAREDRERLDLYLGHLSARLGPAAHPNHVAFHEHFTAYRQWLDGEHQAALTHIMPAFRTGERSGMALFPVHYGNGVAAILQSLGRRREALSWMRRARRAANRQQSPLLVFLTHLRGASLALHANRAEQALPYLRIALKAGASMRIFLHPWIRRCEMARLLQIAIEADIEKDYAAELLRVLGLAAELSGGEAAAIRIVSLGRFDVASDGRSVMTSVKPQRGPIALAVHLIAAGPAGESTETLADRMWPDVDADASRKRMKSTVYRLRQMLGAADAVLTQGGRTSLNEKRISVDAWDLDALATAPGWTAEARYAEALRICPGPFVQHHADDASLMVYSQRIETVAVGICATFVQSLILAGDWPRALRVAREWLDRIGYHERLFDLATQAAEHLGRDAELGALKDLLSGSS
jgi:LuxR family maltose regulon positive regulatory protein